MPPARLRPAELSADGGGAGCALPKDEPLGSTSRGSTAASSTTAASLDGCGSFERGSSPPSTRRSTSRERYEETLDFPVELATAAPPTPDGPPCRAAPLAETRRLTAALREMAALLDLEPRSLRECVRAVAEQGWKNITWRKRYTALHLAAELGRGDVVPLLVALGADPDATDSKGRSPLQVAGEKQHWGCVWALQKVATSHFRACAPPAGEGEESEELDLKCPGSTQPPLLRRALEAARTRRARADEEAQAADEARRLTLALEEMAAFVALEPPCLRESVQYMAATGLPSVEGMGGPTALHLAAEIGNDAVMPLIVMLRADPGQADAQGNTALDVARDRHHWSCVHVLAALSARRASDSPSRPAADGDSSQGASRGIPPPPDFPPPPQPAEETCAACGADPMEAAGGLC